MNRNLSYKENKFDEDEIARRISAGGGEFEDGTSPLAAGLYKILKKYFKNR